MSIDLHEKSGENIVHVVLPLLPVLQRQIHEARQHCEHRRFASQSFHQDLIDPVPHFFAIHIVHQLRAERQHRRFVLFDVRRRVQSRQLAARRGLSLQIPQKRPDFIDQRVREAHFERHVRVSRAVVLFCLRQRDDEARKRSEQLGMLPDRYG